METAEKVVFIVIIFGGFLWLRARARAMQAERQVGRVLIGLFLVLPALLIAERHLFDRLALDSWTGFLVESLALAGTIAAVGFGFLRPPREETSGDET
jgi:hypothetical protein